MYLNPATKFYSLHTMLLCLKAYQITSLALGSNSQHNAHAYGYIEKYGLILVKNCLHLPLSKKM
jgi:hypothetical protein